ncbi:hypothetical protein Q9R38_25255 [Priestia aryabhattai]|uniref:DUF6602 domain-containing protein n=1 Tax=Priestia aryabhattai TaxID=412384 RepID=UPI0028822106|nr:DUF6602 domain-containing protein [Priestia aryabhattai]MDT0149850.1 hypothetical protein [Priestia aryabhattai]MDT0155403.1 hypothetical protein [Priestia aryabhattai]
MSFKFLNAAAEKMLSDHEAIKSVIHNGQKGELREGALREVLKKYLPNKYGVTTGVIVDARGTQSKQQDIIIYDIMTCPVLINEEIRMIPIESVYATIEVKSSLDSTILSEACENIQSVRDLYTTTSPNGVNQHLSIPLGFVFSYSANTEIGTLCQRLISINKEIPKEKQANTVCILDKGIISYFGKEGFNAMSIRPRENYFECAMDGKEGENFITFYLALLGGLKHQLVSFPNMLEYAINAGYLKNNRHIGEQEMPEDAFYINEKGEKIFLYTEKEYRKKENS